MKKRSTLRKIVNLSPLVDVLMIVIFWYIMISNQNLENERIAAQTELTEQQAGYEASIGLLEQELKASKEATANANAYIEELLKELELLRQEKGTLGEEAEGLKENNIILTTENEKLHALLEQEGQFLVLQLLSGIEDLRTLELTYEADTERITFGSEERAEMAEQLRTRILSYLQAGTRISVIFLYTGDNAYARDIAAINETMTELQKEYYFVYSKMNLAR